MTSTLQTSHRCDKWCKGDSLNWQTVARDIRRKASGRKLLDVSESLNWTRGGDIEGMASVNDFGWRAETLSNPGPLEIASAPVDLTTATSPLPIQTHAS